MKVFSLIFCWLIVASTSLAQRYTVLDNNLIFSESNKSFCTFINSIKAKKGSDRKIVKRLFDKAHSDFLKNYRAYAQINDVFEKGDFDCLSGTYFLANSLDNLGLTYKIFETNYHIFLVVQTRRGDILLECTDRTNGFVADKMLIKEKVARYREAGASERGEMYLSKLSMFHEILPSQLPGLFYFNRAVETFNKNQLDDCCFYLEQAWKIYDNPRIEAFAPILLRSIDTSGLGSEAKEKLTATLQAHLRSAAYPIASR